MNTFTHQSRKATILIDACSLVRKRTGIGNYLNLILKELTKCERFTIILASNSEIYFESQGNVILETSWPLLSRVLRGALWINIFFSYCVFKHRPNFVWGVNGLLPFLSLGSRKVLTIHDFTHVFAPGSQRLTSRITRSIFQKRAIERADVILVDSRATLDDLLVLHGDIQQAKAKVLYPPVRVPISISRTLSRSGLANEGWDRYVVTVGTLEPRKNLKSLVEGFLQFKGTFPLSDLKLFLVGGQGWKFNLRAEHQDLIVTGYISDTEKEALIAGATAFIYPSLYEGFGLPITEAQTLGVPVVTSFHPAVIEAAGAISFRIDMTPESISTFFEELESGVVPLSCRLLNTINHSPQMVTEMLVEEVFSNQTH